MRKFILILLCILPFYSRGQIYNDPFMEIKLDTVGSARTLEIGANASLASNAFTNKQYHAVFSQNFIDDNVKNEALPNLTKNNDLAALGYGNIYYSWKPGNDKKYFFINLSSSIQYSALFNADAYKLVMYGNNMFAGETADFSGLNYSHYAYQSLQFGFYNYKKQKGDNLLLYGGGVSLVFGSGYNNISISKGTLYTSPQGDSLSLNADVSSKSVNSSSIMDINGIGASVNGFIGYKFSGNNEIRFQVADLGFVEWFRNVANFNINRQFNYTGEKVSVINGKATYTQYYLTLDTIATQAGHPPAGSSFISGLPFQLRLIYTKDLSPTLSLSGGIEYMHDNMQIPEIDVSMKKSLLNERFSFWAGISAFGYSNYGLNAGLECQVYKRISILIGSRYLDGLFFMNETLGQGYYANLKWEF